MTDARPDETDAPDAARTDALARLVDRLLPGHRLLCAWPLTGGVSAQVTALDVVGPDGRTARLVARRHGATDRARNPHLARDEDRLLRVLAAHGLPVPRPYGYDETGDLLPTPVVVVEHVDHDPAGAPADPTALATEAAGTLAVIHRVDTRDLSFLPTLVLDLGEPPAAPDESLGEPRIRAALATAWPPARPNPPVLLHGDYWPGNLLWRAGRLVAVIDWEDAHLGDPLADLANARLELVMAHGPETADAFTGRYLARSTVDPTDLPTWDLRAALGPCGKLSTWGLDAETEARMRAGHRLSADRALRELVAR